MHTGKPEGFPEKSIFSKNQEYYFFLWRFFLKRFLRLCVAILCLFLFFPLGITNPIVPAKPQAG